MTNAISNVTNILAEVATAASAKEVVVNELQRNKEIISSLYQWIADHGFALLVSLMITCFILLIGWFIIKLLSRAADALLRKTPFNELIVNFLSSVINKTMWILLLMIVLKRLGVDITPLIAGLGVTGFVLGFAFKDALGNLAAGMMIALNQPFKVGDYVTVGGNEGTVKSLNMMMTMLETADSKKIVVPNSVVWGAAITNFSAMPTRRVDISILIGYGADITAAKEIAHATVREIKGVLPSPQPVVEVLSLADSGVQLAIRPFCRPADYWDVYFAAIPAIKAAFEKAGIEIPFKRLDVRFTGDKQPTFVR